MSADKGPVDLLELPALLPARVASQPGRIARIIYQTFKSRHVPASMHAAAKSWIDQNPDYEYRFFGDEDIFAYADSFNCSDFPFSSDDLSRAIRSVKPGAGKADLFRYLIIYDQGGAYMDIDTFCLSPLSTFVHPDDEAVSGIGMRGDLHQWGLVYAAHHPFIKRTIENSVSNILSRKFVPGFENTLEGLAGPPCLDLSIKEILGLPQAAVFQAGLYEIDIAGRKWRIRLLAKDLFDGNVGFKYQDYSSDLSKMGMKHWLQESLFDD